MKIFKMTAVRKKFVLPLFFCFDLKSIENYRQNKILVRTIATCFVNNVPKVQRDRSSNLSEIMDTRFFQKHNFEKNAFKVCFKCFVNIDTFL